MRQSVITIDTALFSVLPVERAYQLGAWPVAHEDDQLTVATASRDNVLLPLQVRNLTGLQVAVQVVSPEELNAAIKVAEGASKVLKEASESFRQEVASEEAEIDAPKSISLNDREEGPVAKLINTIILDAIQRRASDIHIEGHEGGVYVKYRIDGVLYPATAALDRKHLSAIVSRFKVMAELDISEKRVPQDGRFRIRITDRHIDFRISTLPSVHGEDVVIRILDKSNIGKEMNSLGLAALGIDDDVLKKFRRCIKEPYGMVLVTGPTGSGKTTSLYAAVSELNVREEKVITIEDPVEYQLDGIIQIPVNEKKGLTFAKGLRSILRHDPDKIMIGEIRDVETAQIAIQAALTGHLVFTTVHANNVFDVVGRFRHMGLSTYDFVSALNCIMAQRLVRNLCDHCKIRNDLTNEEREESNIDPSRYPDAMTFAEAGCEKCNGTGYSGRTAIVEFLDLSQEMKDMLIEQRPIGEVQSLARREGMKTLRDVAVDKFMCGTTSLREINRVTFID